MEEWRKGYNGIRRAKRHRAATALDAAVADAAAGIVRQKNLFVFWATGDLHHTARRGAEAHRERRRRYSWDVHDRLPSVTTPVGEHGRLRYAPFGRCVAKVRRFGEGELSRAWFAGRPWSARAARLRHCVRRIARVTLNAEPPVVGTAYL